MWKTFGLMCSYSKAHYSSYGTLWYNCNLCAKILWKICSSWSSHCAMCSLCAGYRTLWSLEFTAEGDSTKGKVWQQHQVALEHTQLHNNFLSLFWGVPRAIGTDMVTMESNALKLILTDKQGTSIWIKWSVRNTLLECWNQSELEWTIVIPGQCWGWLTKWEQWVSTNGTSSECTRRCKRGARWPNWSPPCFDIVSLLLRGH